MGCEAEVESVESHGKTFELSYREARLIGRLSSGLLEFWHGGVSSLLPQPPRGRCICVGGTVPS